MLNMCYQAFLSGISVISVAWDRHYFSLCVVMRIAVLGLSNAMRDISLGISMWLINSIMM
jgi:hypothetical protein